VHALSRIALWLLAAVAVVALFVVSCGASAWLHLQTRVGREAFGDAVSGLVESEIPGEFRVEGVREVSPPRVRVDRIEARTEEGDEVMRLEDVTVELDAARSWNERAAIVRSASVGGGTIEVVQTPDGKTTVERAFVRPSPPQPQPPEPGGYVMDLDGLTFEHVRIVLRLGDTRARLSDASGRARVWLREGRDVQMRYSDVNGRLTSSVDLIPKARVRGLDLAFEPEPGGGPIVKWQSELVTPRSDLTVAGYAPRSEGPGVRMCLWTGGAPLASALGIGAEIATSFTEDISFDMRPSRAPAEPTCGEGAT
jgi:hypothetical protein